MVRSVRLGSKHFQNRPILTVRFRFGSKNFQNRLILTVRFRFGPVRFQTFSEPTDLNGSVPVRSGSVPKIFRTEPILIVQFRFGLVPLFFRTELILRFVFILIN